MATRLLCLWKMTSKSCPYRCLSLFSSSSSSSSSSSASASPSFSCVWSFGCEKQWRTHTPTSHQVNKDKHSRTRHYNVSLRRLERHKSERLKIQARAFGLGNSSHQGASITRAFNSKQAQALRMEWTPNKVTIFTIISLSLSLSLSSICALFSQRPIFSFCAVHLCC